jgi:hypothetical protein
MSVQHKNLCINWLTLLQVKLHGISVDDNVERDAHLNCRSNLKHRAEFANSHFPHYVFDLFFVYVPLLHFRYKDVCSNALFQYFAKSSITNGLALQFGFELQIEHFDIYTKLSNTNSVLSHHSTVANIEQIHNETSMSSLWCSDDVMATKIFQRQFLQCPVCSDFCHELRINTYFFQIVFTVGLHILQFRGK